ncbi:hypothetical protein [Brucella pseudogrignonensis]|uniref:Uncharacterized protein n=1 Tax=Brucella pseudogrignonensis TaxID=419475 RepID=A0A256GDQ0_9HYPH|nr:hypothetical protein [Brucella pseudogrignonensis]NKX16146.1 signal recognition particle [Brucella pseudogrignonensis]OYR25257.1 hypothetical protein CEV34_2764 [Brucella pseudogrignonensis]
MKLALAGLALLASSAIASSANFDEQKVANDLGTVLAAEEACGLSYDQDAIQKYVTEIVPSDVTSFPGTLGLWTRTRKDQMQTMTGSEKTAQCASIKSIAKTYGFIK